MIDPQVELVRGYADEVAERIDTLGGSPLGTPCRPTWVHWIWFTPGSWRTPAVLPRVPGIVTTGTRNTCAHSRRVAARGQ
jgi:hypothetical protein